MKSIALACLAIATEIKNAEAFFSKQVQDTFNSIQPFAPRRAYGRTTQEERETFRFFVKNGISREAVAVKFGVSFQTVYLYTRK